MSPVDVIRVVLFAVFTTIMLIGVLSVFGFFLALFFVAPITFAILIAGV